ncbi:MAG: zf-HC2 domain-containing protein [Thermoguttaceae bacterium]|nr:zf-HC2 domain-containing protein [Thermoguttaceae bacterium]MBR4103875.1 zf-HC2 domain-containing protein [Thermoguttaceae bacterium]
MEKRNQEYCKADAIAGLAVLVNSGADHVSDDYGLLESLASDTLSPNEARRFAEHLKTCEECRQECATLWATGFYDDSPFGDRMRAFENDPISETDEHWKTIAVAFNEDLASAAKRSVASFDESVADDLYVAPEFKQALAVWEASKPKARPKAEPRRTAAKWRAFSYSAAAVLLGLVAVQFLETKPPVGPRDYIASQTTGDEPDASTTARSRSIGGVPENGATSENNGEENESSLGTSRAFPSAGMKSLDPPVLAGAKGGASIALLQYECLERNNEHFTAFDGASAIYQKGVEAFDKGNYSKASEKFGELVKLLNGNPKFVEGVKGDLNAALFCAYWNYGVATAKKGNFKDAVDIFEKLKEKKLVPKDKQEGYVDAALEAWKKCAISPFQKPNSADTSTPR